MSTDAWLLHPAVWTELVLNSFFREEIHTRKNVLWYISVLLVRTRDSIPSCRINTYFDVR